MYYVLSRTLALGPKRFFENSLIDSTEYLLYTLKLAHPFIYTLIFSSRPPAHYTFQENGGTITIDQTMGLRLIDRWGTCLACPNQKKTI